MSSLHEIKVGEDKVIRGACLLNGGTRAAITAMLQVLIVDTRDGSIVGIIKRLSPPRVVVPIPNKHFMLVHYSDNYCIMYDTVNFEPIYTILGMAHDHKGIKVSEDGNHLLYGNNNAVQMWNVNSCQIQLLSHKYKFTSAYALNGDASQIYLGTYNGYINFVITKTMKQLNNSKLPIGQEIKVHDKCVMAIQPIDAHTLASVDYGLQFAIIKVDPTTISFNYVCKIEYSPQITKPIVFVYSRNKGKLYMEINDIHYSVDYKTGRTDIVSRNSK